MNCTRRGFLAAAGFAGMAALCAFGPSAAGATHAEKLRAVLDSGDRDYVFVTMHRGDWRSYPENSRDAIKGSIAKGADIVELDVCRTKDGRFVLLHDRKLDRVTNGKGKVADRTLAEIKKLRLKSNQGGKDAKATDYEVLTLEEALALAKDKIIVNIDKFTQHPYEILKAVDQADAMRGVLVKSTLRPADAKKMLREYWARVESGELLYMPVVQFCWKHDNYADEMMPQWLATEPRKASMYEFCMDSDKGAAKLESIRFAPGSPRIWINTMWDSLNCGRGEARGFTNPAGTWGWSLEQGATMLQTDYGAELLVYLNNIGRHTL